MSFAKYIKCVLLVGLVSFTLVSCARTDTSSQSTAPEQLEQNRILYRQAIALRNSKNSADLLEAEQLLLKLSKESVNEQMHNAAALSLGLIYSSKLYPPQPDYQKAIYWLTIAAESGNYIAQNNLGLLYLGSKTGTPKDLDKAEYWFRKSIEKEENANAMDNLGLVLTTKSPANRKEAGQWYCRAADKGSISGQYNCAIALYSDDVGISDYKRAYRYILLAEKNWNNTTDSDELMSISGQKIKAFKNKIKEELSPTDLLNIESLVNGV